VALAYRSAADPSGEIALATPMAGLRMVAARGLLVASVAAPLGVLPAVLLDVPLHLAAAWLLPGLALSSLVLLAGTTRFDPATVVAVLGTAWALAVATPGATRRMTAHAVAEQVASSETQVTAVAVVVVALALTFQRRQHISYRRSA
jgi:hypothetical protein